MISWRVTSLQSGVIKFLPIGGCLGDDPVAKTNVPMNIHECIVRHLVGGIDFSHQLLFVGHSSYRVIID